MSSFAGVSFIVTEGGFSDRSGLVEEWQATIIVADSTTWGALFAQLTPKDLVSNRACRGRPGFPPSIITDIGGGAGPGALVIDNYDTHNALLIDLSSEAPIVANGARAAKAVWQILP